MSLAIVHARAQLGIHAPLVSVEVHISNGLPAFAIVGLPETAVKESKDRVRSAILNSQLDFPQRRITVNLAPADLPKEGGRYDLAIALGILAASEQIPAESLKNHVFLGELALSGKVRPIHACVPAAIACGKDQQTLIVPKGNEHEASLCDLTQCYLTENLLSTCAYLHNRHELPSPQKNSTSNTQRNTKDLSDVKGQVLAKRALEVAAAGGHNLLFFGPPGSGKSMMAARLPGILPSMTNDEALESAAIGSLHSQKHDTPWGLRPFRQPHHTSSAVAVVGGGSNPKPGEISLSHNGVLFLDELPEFSRHVLEVLREPLETGCISISRANASVNYPAQFQLIAAMNPCPCGYHGDNSDRCRCTPTQIQRYRDKISGPLLDRIDLHVGVHALPIQELQTAAPSEPSQVVQARVSDARRHQHQRQNRANSLLTGKLLDAHCRLGEKEAVLLGQAMQKLQLSARAYDRIRRVARTIADLAGSQNIERPHIVEALSYRQLDRHTS